MSNERARYRRSDTRLIVPVTVSTDPLHTIKYFILNEEPKNYICEKGCIHEYPSSSKKDRLFSGITPATRDSSPYKNTEKLKRTLSPVAYRYLASGKTEVSLLKKNESLYSSESPCSSVTLGKVMTPLVESQYSSIRSSKTFSPLRSCIKLPQVETPKSLIQEMTQTYGSVGCKLHPGLSTIRNSARRFLNRPSDEEQTIEIEEKEYDKNSDVFTRLYPYIQKPKTVPDESKPKMDWQNYQRLNVIYDFMDELETLYPSLCTVGVIGHSVEGRDIKLLKISNGHANNSAVWMDAGIHAREWIGPAVNTYIANHIARNFDKLPTSCTNKDWYFLPVANPDGYEFSHTHNRMWRKNRAWSGGKCVGVDLNRNFSVAWGGKGSSGDPNNCFFRGPHAFSEPESCALKSVLQDSQLPFKVYITLHAFGEVIIFPLAHSDDLCPDYVRLLNGATAMSRAIFNTNGTTYRVGVSKDVMYRASGTSNDWCYSAVGIPYCYLIELRNKKHKFKLPEPQIMDTGLEILNCVKALMEFVDTYPLQQNSGDHMQGLRKSNNLSKFAKVAPSPGSSSRTQVWELRFMLEGQRSFVKTLDTVGVINIWKEEPSTMDVMVEGPRIGQLAGLLNERGIPYSIALSDVGAMIATEQGTGISKLKPSNAGSMDWTHYHKLSTIYTFMDSLAREYPYLVTLHTIGKSVEGRNIVMMKISNGKTGNTGVWIDGAIHPREWISAAVVTYIANALVHTYHDMPSSITNKDWYILPILNPDGYDYTHTHDRMWRKNRAHYGECIGVDLNRNFSFGWGENGEEGSSEDPGNIFFRGPQPFSEPETAAVRNAIMAADVPFKVFLSFHSYGEVIIFPWGYTSDACPTYVELLEGGTAMAKAIFETSGRVYKVGSTKDLMYYAAGTSIDWSYGTVKIPYSYMIELRGKKHRFLLPKDEILSTAQEVWNGVLRLMDFIDHRCKSTQHCVCHK